MLKKDKTLLASIETYKTDIGCSLNYTQSTIIDVMFELKALNIDKALNCQEIEQSFRKKGYMCSRECIYVNLNYLLSLNAISVVTKKLEKRPYIYHYYIAIEED